MSGIHLTRIQIWTRPRPRPRKGIGSGTAIAIATALLLLHPAVGTLHAGTLPNGLDSKRPAETSAHDRSGPPGNVPVQVTGGDRVVVQSPALGPVLDERDGFALVVVCPNRRCRSHLLELHDLSGPHLIRVLEFSSEIEHAVLGPEGSWCIVSLRGVWSRWGRSREIWSRGAACGEPPQLLRIDLSSGDREVITVHAYGVLALDDASRRLALLGSVPHRGHESGDHGAKLGVWDLNEAKWIDSVRTPLFGRLAPPPAWSQDRVLVEGPDQHVMAQRPFGFRWLTTLDLATGEFETVQGPPNRSWANDDEWMSPLTAAQAERSKQWEPRLRERWNLDPDPGSRPSGSPDVTVAMVESSGNELVIAMQQHRGPIWTIHLDRQGRIRNGDFDTILSYREAPNATAGRLLMIRRISGDRRSVYDYVAREAIATLPLAPGHGGGGRYPIHRFLPQGWIEVDRERLTYHDPGGGSEPWTIEFPEHPHPYQYNARRVMLHRISGSPDGRFLTTGRFGEPSIELDIRRSDTGDVLFTVSGQAGPHSTVAPTAFDAGGDSLAVAYGTTIDLYAVPTGERLGRKSLGMRSPPQRIIPLENGWWVLQGRDQLVVLDEQLEERMDLPIKSTLSASLAGARADPVADPMIVLVGELGEVHVVGLHDGQVRKRWRSSLPGVGPGQREGPLQAMVVFDGNVLIRSTGAAGAVEVRRVPELDLVATIHSMIADDGQPGWVVSTPAGDWNASGNAEGFVQVFQGLVPVGPGDFMRYRQPQEISRQLGRAIRGER